MVRSGKLGRVQRYLCRACKKSFSAVSTPHTTVGDYLKRAARAGLSWPLPEGLDETRLEQLLFPPPVMIPAAQRPVPDWATIHQELKRKGVALGLLWEEYQSACPEGYRFPAKGWWPMGLGR